MNVVGNIVVASKRFAIACRSSVVIVAGHCAVGHEFDSGQGLVVSLCKCL